MLSTNKSRVEITVVYVIRFILNFKSNERFLLTPFYGFYWGI